ncbi:MAG: hypothetical protein JEZ07_13050 [Phycisphaerae bacterium]|nr:hypothetical protein [Phycisphaerae bacterium]
MIIKITELTKSLSKKNLDPKTKVQLLKELNSLLPQHFYLNNVDFIKTKSLSGFDSFLINPSKSSSKFNRFSTLLYNFFNVKLHVCPEYLISKNANMALAPYPNGKTEYYINLESLNDFKVDLNEQSHELVHAFFENLRTKKINHPLNFRITSKTNSLTLDKQNPYNSNFSGQELAAYMQTIRRLSKQLSLSYNKNNYDQLVSAINLLKLFTKTTRSHLDEQAKNEIKTKKRLIELEEYPDKFIYIIPLLEKAIVLEYFRAPTEEFKEVKLTTFLNELYNTVSYIEKKLIKINNLAKNKDFNGIFSLSRKVFIYLKKERLK